MALFTDEEKQFLQEALGVYLQLVQQRISREQAAPYLEMAQNVLEKVDLADGAGGGTPSEKPRGISDEWFQACCLSCDKLAPGGKCNDKITEKFPGKCDPIILYERAKQKPNA
ncbi:MAG: hypothetical protein JNL74_18370 [Fibrobacteres bacterium]|nr:hypothetical protein [Fibrobacterota bacterium]